MPFMNGLGVVSGLILLALGGMGLSGWIDEDAGDSGLDLCWGKHFCIVDVHRPGAVHPDFLGFLAPRAPDARLIGPRSPPASK
jgi:hypothetical protein